MLCEERDGMIVTCPRSFQDDARLKLSADGWDGGGPFFKKGVHTASGTAGVSRGFRLQQAYSKAPVHL